jgi:prevent-host-death family protein
MGKVSIRDLHLHTGELVRRAAAGGSVVVTDRGRPVASLVPYEPTEDGTPFSARRLLPEFAALSRSPGDTTAIISEDRDRA